VEESRKHRHEFRFLKDFYRGLVFFLLSLSEAATSARTPTPETTHRNVRITVRTESVGDPRYQHFRAGFFARSDETDDARFYEPTRLVTHVDDGAIAAISALYEELGLANGDVLDLMSSWVSHFTTPPKSLTVLGMNAIELEHNPMATRRVVHDLNREPTLPFGDAQFDSAVCVVSIDYLSQPIEVLEDLARVVRPGGFVVITFSNRCFPTKAIHGWLQTDDATHCRIVEKYLELAGGWESVRSEQRPTAERDPLFAVTALRS
jgi:SAM-dependent methyltransferase